MELYCPIQVNGLFIFVMKQLTLHPGLKYRGQHGGDLGRGKRKTERPIVTKKPMHLVLRAECARGPLSLLKKRNAEFIRDQMRILAARWHVRVMETANVGNHLHLLVQGKTRKGIQNFMRGLAGRVAQFVTGARKGKPFGKRFWTLTIYSRIVEWGRDLNRVCNYIELNRREARGEVVRKSGTVWLDLVELSGG